MNELDPAAAQAIAAAPMPTRATLRHRSNVPLQLLRLARLNIRMIKVIGKSEKSHG